MPLILNTMMTIINSQCRRLVVWTTGRSKINQTSKMNGIFLILHLKKIFFIENANFKIVKQL